MKVRDRIKRTNPFLLRIRGITTVREWAERQIQGALFASEEEAVGHLLEAIAINCHPGGTVPRYPEDFDYEVEADGAVEGYQVKLSWDCMPMSSRKNLSRTIGRLEEQYRGEGKEFVGYFAPCYGKAKTTRPPGQRYVSLRSREFWSRVGGGDDDFDLKVGEVVALTCGEFRGRLERELIPRLVADLASAASPLIGDADGNLDMRKLFRAVNR
ncbi:MAG TPA: PmeII family type II restriction endonuclease [Vicinamibacteria bacterium]